MATLSRNSTDAEVWAVSDDKSIDDMNVYGWLDRTVPVAGSLRHSAGTRL